MGNIGTAVQDLLFGGSETVTFKKTKIKPVVDTSPSPVVRSAPTPESMRLVIEGYLEYLKVGSDIWDMRAWNKHKDPDEVTAYVATPTHKNSGHTAWCVIRLKELGVQPEVIVAAIMQNSTHSWDNRLVPCMIEGINCSEFLKHNNEYGAYCSEICNPKPAPKPKKVKVKVQAKPKKKG